MTKSFIQKYQLSLISIGFISLVLVFSPRLISQTKAPLKTEKPAADNKKPDYKAKDKSGRTLLHEYVAGNKIDLVKEALKQGAEVDAQDNQRITPLHLASIEGHDEIVQVLIMHKADVNAQNINGLTPLHAAAFAGSIKVAKILLEHKATINTKSKLGQAPLHYAIVRNRKDMVAFLLNQKADVNIKDNIGGTPLLLACYRGYIDIIKLLLNNGADVKPKITGGRLKGINALHFAIMADQHEACKLLLEKGSDVNDPYRDGYTPLHIAVLRTNPLIIQLLIKKGAKLDVKNKQNQTPMDIAKKAGNQFIIKVLKGEKISDVDLRLLSLGLEPVNQKAPNFNLHDLKGNKVSLQDFKGKVVFLNIWATWCGPCRLEMPGMDKLYKQLAKKDFVMLAVSTGEKKETVSNYMKSQALTFPILIDPDATINKLYPGDAIPRTYIIDKQGNIIAKVVGSRNWHDDKYLRLFEKLSK